MYVYIHIYIYIYRERDINIYIDVYIYIYIHAYMCNNKDRLPLLLVAQQLRLDLGPAQALTCYNMLCSDEEYAMLHSINRVLLYTILA